jgi:hypothetical protein
MSLCVERLPGQPIILMTFDSATSSREVVEAHFMALELARPLGGPVHHVVDLLDVGIGYPMIVNGILNLLQAQALSVPERQQYTWVVAPHFVDEFPLHGLSVFSTVEEAIAFIQVQLLSTEPLAL